MKEPKAMMVNILVKFPKYPDLKYTSYNLMEWLDYHLGIATYLSIDNPLQDIPRHECLITTPSWNIRVRHIEFEQ